MTCKLMTKIFLFKDSHSDFPVANLLFGDTFWVRVGHVMNLAMGTERIYIIKGIARVYSSPERVSCSGIGLMKRK